MTTARDQRSALVSGASAFLGRWLVKELLDQGVRTTAAVRSTASTQVLGTWLEAQGVANESLQHLLVDLRSTGSASARTRCPRFARSTTSPGRTRSG